MKILRVCVAVGFLTIAIFFCMHTNLAGSDFYDIDYSSPDEVLSMDKKIQTAVFNQKEDLTGENITTETPIKDIESATIEIPSTATTALITPEPTVVQSKDTFARITIKTDKKVGTYTVMPDVYESTLKHNIGWLPSSSMPGKEGVCVLMGHRDTDFGILQHLNVGDKLIVKRQNNNYCYTVCEIKIVNSDSELRFDVFSNFGLVLVTCYPFSYSGHALKKITIYGIYKPREG